VPLNDRSRNIEFKVNVRKTLHLIHKYECIFVFFSFLAWESRKDENRLVKFFGNYFVFSKHNNKHVYFEKTQTYVWSSSNFYLKERVMVQPPLT
jgi:hypothetical protein